MRTEVKIKNIGKLDDAVIHLDRFTVLAGPNNSGKSFVSKTVYSVITALRANHVKQYFSHLSKNMDTAYTWQRLRIGNREKDLHDTETEFVDRFLQLQSFMNDSEFNNFEEIDDTISELRAQIDLVHDVGSKIKKKPRERRIGSRNRYVSELFNAIKILKKELDQKPIESIILQGRELELEKKLIDNFQVTHVSRLGTKEREPLHISLEEIGKIEYLNGKFTCDLQPEGIGQLHGFSTVTYLESPIYMKLMRVLESRYLISSISHRRQISGVPGYFYDLANILKFEFVGDIAFPDLFGKLTSNEILGGQLALSDSGRIFFQENGRQYDLSVTATGIANLGLLALLIERKALDKKSLLFIDEPEAHLHPSWQVFMAESLFELAKQGVHVVIATHSIEILKWLEVHIKNNPEDKSFVALNRFPMNNSPLFDQSDNYDFETNLSKIKQDLAKPFTELYIDGI